MLLELGEPAKLAASYAGRTLALIGPELYLDYVRLLKLLAVIVLPISTISYFVIQAVLGTPLGGLIGGTVGLAISVAVHLAFWTTLVFVIVERTGTTGLKGAMSPGGPNVAYDPKLLPAIPVSNGAALSDLVASLVFLVLLPVAWTWDQIAPFVRNADGAAVPVLHPATSSFWLPYYLVLILLAAVFAIVLYRTGRWTWPLVVTNAVIAVAATIPVVGLILNGMLLNRAFVDELGWTTAIGAGSPAATATSAALVAVTLWAIGDSIWKTIQADRLGRVRS